MNDVKNAYFPAATLQSISRLLDWDQETYMPKGGIAARSLQKEYIAGLEHAARTSDRFKSALGQMIDIDTGEILANLSDEEAAAVKAWRKDYLQATKLPNSFVEKWAKTTSESAHVWETAKLNNDFSSFAPHLEKVFSLARERAELLGYDDHPYNALLNEYEPDMTVCELDPLFSELKPFLTNLTKEATSDAPPLPPGPYPIDEQTTFCLDLLTDMGLTPHNTKLSVSAHPFCMSLHPDDLRLTTHIDHDTPIPNLSAVMHEGGHGLYEAGLPAKHFGTPLAESISLGIHESQSRFWEVLIGQSLPFWECYYPKLQSHFPQLQDYPLDHFYQHLNQVQPSFIRVHADEVTYTLHVILRYELEKELLTGTLSPKDIPEAWNAKMEELLSITPPTDTLGCLQDVHWSMGLIGYFPTYALGNLYSTQFYAQFAQAHPNYTSLLTQGELRPITSWLRENIHCHGRRFSASELVQRVTNAPLSTTPYRTHLSNKYAESVSQG